MSSTTRKAIPRPRVWNLVALDTITKMVGIPSINAQYHKKNGGRSDRAVGSVLALHAINSEFDLQNMGPQVPPVVVFECRTRSKSLAPLGVALPTKNINITK